MDFFSKHKNTIITLVYLICIAGYVLNIIKTVLAFQDDATNEAVLRLFALAIAPIGVIAGYF